jgi:hypothetical protein
MWKLYFMAQLLIIQISNIKTKTMKTITNQQEKAKRVKAMIIAVLISIQTVLIAGDSSSVNKEFTITSDAYIAGTELPNTSLAQNAYSYIHEEAFETEMEIEDWMCNIHNDSYTVVEEEYELEEWMCNTHHSFWNDLYEAEEPELAIEQWMTKPNEWLKAIDEIILTSK